jgi:hypothetical protein
MSNLYLMCAWLCSKLAQQERDQHQPRWFALGPCQKVARVQVCLQPVREKSLTRASESVFTSVIRAHLAARREKHGPKPDPCAELHRSTSKWQRIQPEYGAIDLTLPGCTREWTAIERRSIQIPRLECIRL